MIWKKVRGQKGEVDVETARARVARGETNAAPAPSKEPLAPCPTPGCGGQIVENSRAYGCTSFRRIAGVEQIAAIRVSEPEPHP